MRVTVLTVGSRGDVQPFLALGLGLEQAGHEVCVATHPKYAPLVSRAGLRFAPLAEGELSEGPGTAEGRRWLHHGSRRLPLWVGLVRDARTVAGRRLRDALQACRDADGVVASDLATLLGWQASEVHGIPVVRARLNVPGRLDSGPSDPVAAALRQAAWRAARPWLSRVRRDAGLGAPPVAEPIGALARSGVPTLLACSPAVLAAGRAPGRPGGVQATGYWFLDRALDPPAPEGLLDFLAAGPAPVCVGFGSMLDEDPVATTDLAVEALDRAGERGVLLRGQWGLRGTALPPTVFAVDAVAHDWLFARCATVVHHGGAGTTAAALRAGVPSVPVPHMTDQHRWSRVIHGLAVSTAPIPRRRLTAPRLAAALAAAREPGLQRRATELSRRIAAEDGVSRAVALIERHLGDAAGAPPARAGDIHTEDQEIPA